MCIVYVLLTVYSLIGLPIKHTYVLTKFFIVAIMIVNQNAITILMNKLSHFSILYKFFYLYLSALIECT